MNLHFCSAALNSHFSAETEQTQQWLDLGCGGGTFTLALAEYLPAGSEVIGVDQTPQNPARQPLDTLFPAI